MDNVRSPLLTSGSAAAKREEIGEYFHRTYDLYERLFDCLTKEIAYYERPEPLRHPLVFYFGHTATFYMNKLVDRGLVQKGVNDELERMLAVGVDEMSWDDLNEEHYDWPTVSTLRAYRDEVRSVVDNALRSARLSMPITWDDPFWALMMGVEHERIHLETSSVLIRQLDAGFVTESVDWPICRNEVASVAGSELPEELIPAGHVELGRRRPSATYGWDNEYGDGGGAVRAFKAGASLVSNEVFRRFVQAGGYEERQWWSKEGWQWKTYKGVSCPTFWVPAEGDRFLLRNMTSEVPLPGSWPAEVNFHEADAFCKWASNEVGRILRLPTEREWQRLYETSVRVEYPHWRAGVGNIHLDRYASSCPVTEHEQGKLYDVIGNVWQWTSTPIDGLSGFRPHPLYEDFSKPTFDSQHNVIKGGSWISTGNEAHNESRYSFRRHFYQHAGFRLVESVSG